MYRFIGLLLGVVVVNAYRYMDATQYGEDIDPFIKMAELMKGMGDRDTYDELLDQFPLDERADRNYYVPYGDMQFPGDYGTIARQRDIEVPENHDLAGSKSISGGTGRNMQIGKSDKVLPAYCNPPNPCPKGQAKRGNCLTADEFKNTAEVNEAFNARQNCPCDEEHMRSCSKEKSKINTKATENESASQAILNELSDGGLLGNPYTTGEKRHTLVAKKSPGMIRKKRSAEYPDFIEVNPNLVGEKLRRAAKKSPEIVNL